MRLRSHLLLLTLATLLPMVLLAVGVTILTARRERDLFRRGAQDRTLALLTALDTELSGHVTNLRGLASSRHLETGDLRAFHEEARRMLPTQPNWRDISLTLPAGQLAFRTAQPFGAELSSLLDGPSFEAAVRTGQPTIGSLVREAGVYWFPVRLPVLQEGRTRYVLSALVDPGAVLALLSPQRLTPDEVGVVVDGNHRIVARTVSHERRLGQPASQSLRAALARGGEGWFEGSTLEGNPVYTPFNRSRFSGWTVALGIPRVAVDAAATRTAWMLTLGTLAAVVTGLVLALALGHRISRPMASLASAATGLGAGAGIAPPTPGGVREVDDVRLALAQASRDVREREDALRAADRAKDEFLAMLGHELRNPLGALLSAATLLKLSPTGDVSASATAIVERQVRHMVRLVDDLLDASRATTGKIQLARRPLNLGDVAIHAVDVLRSAGRLDQHEVALEVAPVWVEADEARMEQVVANLVGNALKYTAPRGRITVRVSRRGSEAVLEVDDTGVGVAPELLPRVFDLFVQGERSLDRSSGGLGIGLTMVKRLAELHGGRVTAASAGAGRGAQFTVILPAMAAPHPAAPETAESRPGAAACRVLLVEDNDDVRETMRAALEHYGHRVFAAADGPGGVQAAADSHPDVVVVDIGLPGFDGYEVARRIRAASEGRSTFLIALTGYGQQDAREQALQAGFHEHLTKPVAPDRLARLIEAGLTGHSGPATA